MKKYRVKVNGTAYEIELEELTGAAAAPPAAAPQSRAAAIPEPGTNPDDIKGERVTAPMPGTILSVNVSVGEMVKRGQMLMILEAMKMENEILSPRDGRILYVGPARGDTVESAALLCIIDRRS